MMRVMDEEIERVLNPAPVVKVGPPCDCRSCPNRVPEDEGCQVRFGKGLLTLTFCGLSCAVHCLGVHGR